MADEGLLTIYDLRGPQRMNCNDIQMEAEERNKRRRLQEDDPDIAQKLSKLEDKVRYNYGILGYRLNSNPEANRFFPELHSRQLKIKTTKLQRAIATEERRRNFKMARMHERKLWELIAKEDLCIDYDLIDELLELYERVDIVPGHFNFPSFYRY